MSWATVAAARVLGLFRHKRRERELDDEVHFHLEMQIDDNVKTGMPPADARNAALRSFGGVQPIKEQYREQSAFAFVETMARDVRYAMRDLRKNPGFAATSVAVLALAIGANTAMFSVLNAVLFRPLPFRSPDQLTMLWTEAPSQNLRQGRSAYWNIEQWRSQSGTIEDLAFFDGVSVTFTGADTAERISAVRTSPNIFGLLGVQPQQGRFFSAEEAEQRQRLAVISDRLWKNRFGGSPHAIGASIELDGRSSRIIGILPAEFQFVGLAADVWEPHTLFPDWDALRTVRGNGGWSVVARLRANATLDQAQTELSTIARRLDEQLPVAARNRGVSVVPLSMVAVGTRSRRALWLFAAAIGCVLLIAAANAASLSLARSVGRAREMAIRAALGASSGRIVRQLLAEGVTLAVVSGFAGSILALGGIRLVRTFGPADLARLNEVSLDPRVLGWALAISLFTGILVALAPALTMQRRSLQPSSFDGGRSVSGGVATRSIRRALVIGEFALAIVLLVGAGLLIRSWKNVESVDSGFGTARILTMQLRTPAFMPAAQRPALYSRVLEEIQSLPGVERAGFSSELFINSIPELLVTTEANAATGADRFQFRRDEVTAGFFTTLGTPLLRGRFFSAEDGPEAPLVAIVNDAMSRRLWPGSDPLGKRFRVGPPITGQAWFTVVGVVANMRRQGPEIAPVPEMFEAVAQNPSRAGHILIRTSMDDPMKMAAAVRAAVSRVEKNAPIHSITTLDNLRETYLMPRRFQTFLMAGFSVVALLMAAIGIYGLIQYSIAARTQEIGIRMAIGAQAGSIFRMVIGEGIKLSLAGMALGLVGALWVGQAGRSFLFGVSATDPLTLIAVSLLLIAVSMAACYFPAWRAMKVDPVVALRRA